MSMYYGLGSKVVAFAFETITVEGTAIGPTLATIAPSDGFEATYGLFTVKDDDVRFRFDGGDPTASVGHYLEDGQNLEMHGVENLKNLKFIQVNTAAKVSATYAR